MTESIVVELRPYAVQHSEDCDLQAIGRAVQSLIASGLEVARLDSIVEIGNAEHYRGDCDCAARELGRVMHALTLARKAEKASAAKGVGWAAAQDRLDALTAERDAIKAAMA